MAFLLLNAEYSVTVSDPCNEKMAGSHSRLPDVNVIAVIGQCLCWLPPSVASFSLSFA
jgi:hypothetical protein